MDFAARNHLPHNMQEAMLAHMRLKFKTESLHQENVVTNLPKALRAVIAQHLFLPTVEEVYLFKGTSYDFLHQLVSFMFTLLAHHCHPILIDCTYICWVTVCFLLQPCSCRYSTWQIFDMCLYAGNSNEG
jgi:hypothetical protein